MSIDDTNASVQLGTDGALGTLVGRAVRGWQLSEVEAAIGTALTGVFWVEFTIEAENVTGKNLLGSLLLDAAPAGGISAVYNKMEMLRVGLGTTGLPIEVNVEALFDGPIR
jgi:hypothetical protein